MNAKSTLGRFVLAFVILVALLRAFPSPVPTLAAGVLQAWTSHAQTDYTLKSFSVTGTHVHVTATSGKFGKLSRDGAPVPDFTFDGALEARDLNLYPVICIPLLLALPGQRRRHVALTLLLSIPLMALAAALDLYVSTQWQHAHVIEKMLPHIMPGISGTPENQAACNALTAWLDQITAAKAFLNTGGRPFLAILIAMICGLHYNTAIRPIHGIAAITSTVAI